MEVKFEDKLKEIEINIFKGIHDFGRERVNISQYISTKITVCDSIQTSHALSLKMNDVVKVGYLTISHIDCAQPDSNYIACKDMDAAFNIDVCQEFALDISNHTSIQIGDQAVAFGLGSEGKEWMSWVGHLSGKHNELKGMNWNSKEVPHVDGEFMFSAHGQHGGMSGGVVLNGCGYVGSAHSVRTAEKFLTTWAVVLPSEYIRKCMMVHFGELLTTTHCHRTKILQAPSLTHCIHA